MEVNRKVGETFSEFQQRKWKPAVHCSNCLNCKVVKADGVVLARCSKGHGDDKPLEEIIRQPYGRGWRQAKSCNDYISMDD